MTRLLGKQIHAFEKDEESTESESSTSHYCDKSVDPPKQSSFQRASTHDGKSKEKTCKQVSFHAPANDVRPIPHIDDMSDRQVKATWYESEDYRTMKQSVIPLVQKLVKDESVKETDTQTVRGLEYRTRDGAKRRQQNKLEGWNAVLDEQERHLQFGNSLIELKAKAISKAYRKVSRKCRAQARQIGQADEEFAASYLADVPISWKTSPRCTPEEEAIKSPDRQILPSKATSPKPEPTTDCPKSRQHLLERKQGSLRRQIKRWIAVTADNDESSVSSFLRRHSIMGSAA